ncbi:MAG: hypothetical protein ACOYKZ_04645 [Chlamydiia bacterium]
MSMSTASARLQMSPVVLTTSYQEGSEDYRSASRHMTEIEKKTAQQRIQQTIAAPSFEAEAEHLSVSLRDGCWDSSIMQEEELPHLARALLWQGKIDALQFDTIQTFWVCREVCRTRSLRLVMVPLFTDGKTNPQAFRLILESIQSDCASALHSGMDWATTMEICTLFTRAKALPKCAQTLFVFNDPSFYSSIDRYVQTSIGQYFYISGYRVLSCGRVDTVAKGEGGREVEGTSSLSDGTSGFSAARMRASIYLEMELRSILFGDLAVRPVPVLVPSGGSPIDSFAEGGFARVRDRAVPFPGHKPPKETDRNCTSAFPDSEEDAQLEFAIHEDYHLSMASCLPQSVTKASIALGTDLLAQPSVLTSRKSKDTARLCKVVGAQFYDLDGGRAWRRLTRTHPHEPVDAIAWCYLDGILEAAVLNEFLDRVQGGPSRFQLTSEMRYVARRVSEVIHLQGLLSCGPDTALHLKSREVEGAKQLAEGARAILPTLSAMLGLSLYCVLQDTWNEIEQTLSQCEFAEDDIDGRRHFEELLMAIEEACGRVPLSPHSQLLFENSRTQRLSDEQKKMLTKHASTYGNSNMVREVRKLLGLTT